MNVWRLFETKRIGILAGFLFCRIRICQRKKYWTGNEPSFIGLRYSFTHHTLYTSRCIWIFCATIKLSRRTRLFYRWTNLLIATNIKLYIEARQLRDTTRAVKLHIPLENRFLSAMTFARTPGMTYAVTTRSATARFTMKAFPTNCNKKLNYV